jgi:hypothetical protein
MDNIAGAAIVMMGSAEVGTGILRVVVIEAVVRWTKS